jgi:hypothetical protein
MVKDDFSRLEARWRKRPLFRRRRTYRPMVWLATLVLAGLALVALAEQLDALSIGPLQGGSPSSPAPSAAPPGAAKELEAHDTRSSVHPADQRSRPHQG